MANLTVYDVEALKVHYTNYLRGIMAKCAQEDIPTSEITRTAVEVGMFITYVEEVIKDD